MLFSIITPTYNRVDCLQECVESVAAQPHAGFGFEQVIIDDGSTDGTPALVQNLAQTHTFIQSLAYTPNRGVNHARNRGIELATGTFIIFLDSDDMLNKDVLQQIAQVIEANPANSHFCFEVSTNSSQYVQSQEFTYKDWLTRRVHGDFLHVIKRELLLQFPFFEEYRAFEVLNWARIIKQSEPCLFVPLKAVTVRMREGDSLSGKLYRLPGKQEMQESFTAGEHYLNLYGADLRAFSKTKFYQKVLLLLVHGLRAKQYAGNKRVIQTWLGSGLVPKAFALACNNALLAGMVQYAYTVKRKLS